MQDEIPLARLIPPHLSSLTPLMYLILLSCCCYFSKADPEIQRMLPYSSSSNTQKGSQPVSLPQSLCCLHTAPRQPL